MNNALYRVFDDRFNHVFDFTGNHQLFQNFVAYGRLTQNTNNQMMVVIGKNGLEYGSEGVAVSFKVVMREGWKVVKIA